MNEHEFEPVPGLPEPLPAGERILWQGAPRAAALAVRAFHVRKVGAYFALLMAWRAATDLADGLGAAAAATSAIGLLPVALVAIGLLALLARATARSTLYTITDQRVVMRFGIALTMALNVPFRTIESAALRRHGDGTGDLPLALADGQRISYFVNWPHVRPGRRGKAQPMLRAVPDADRVAELLSAALAAYAGPSAQAPRLVPERDPAGQQRQATAAA